MTKKILLCLALCLFQKIYATPAIGFPDPPGQICYQQNATNAAGNGPGAIVQINCPIGMTLIWTQPPPDQVDANMEFEMKYHLSMDSIVDQSTVVQPSIFFGRGFQYPHANIHACALDFGFCDPNSNHTNANGDRVIQLTRELQSNIPNWTSSFALAPGTYSVVAHVFFYDAENVGYTFAIGNQVVANEIVKNAFPVWSIIVTVIAAIAILCCLVAFYLLFVQRKKLRKVKKPAYPKNMPAPDVHPDALEALRQMDGPLPRSQFVLLEEVGRGAFGAVHKGAIFYQGKAAICAIKTLNEPETGKQEFMDEANIMKSLNHENVVAFLGVSEEEVGEPLCLFLEFLPHGDLKKYLSSQINNNFSTAEMTYICHNIASGMEYLASQNLVHRDLAARNVMLSSSKNEFGFPRCKIADFGLARAKNDEQEYVMESSAKLPVRWLAIESITNRLYTEKSDVWAFGVTVWEVFSYGLIPYSDVNTFSIVASIASGVRLINPEKCPKYIWNYTSSAFSVNPAERPDFKAFSLFMKEAYETELKSFDSKPEYCDIDLHDDIDNQAHMDDGYFDFNGDEHHGPRSSKLIPLIQKKSKKSNPDEFGAPNGGSAYIIDDIKTDDALLTDDNGYLMQ